MTKLLAAALLALTASLGASAKPVDVTTAPDLRSATGQTSYGQWYCTKMRDRCDAGDANACTLVIKHCD